MTAEITHRDADGVRIVTFSGDLDAFGVAEHADDVLARLATADLDAVFDLRAVDYADSSSLAFCLRVRGAQGDRGRGFAVLVSTGPVRRVFEITALDVALNVHGDMAAAVAAATG